MNMQLWQTILAVAMPLVVARVVATQWPIWAKVATALVTSVIVGTVGAGLDGELTSAGSWAAAVGKAFAVSQVAYHTFWKPTKVGEMIESKQSWITDWINKVVGFNPSMLMLATVSSPAAPTLGETVHYRGKQGLLAARTAVVIATTASLDPRGVASGDVPALDDAFHVHLWVYTPSVQGGFVEFNVPMGHSPDGEPTTVDTIPPGSWCWPPRV